MFLLHALVSPALAIVDTDGDSLADPSEDVNGNGRILDDDTDADGVPNYRDADDDGDGLPTLDELAIGTDWLDVDTDGGGTPDGDEVRNGRDPLDPADDARLVFEVGRPSPGAAGMLNTWTVTGATPGAVVVVFGGTRGVTPIPQCLGNNASLANPVRVGSAVADPAGTAVVSANIPAGYAGMNVIFQAIEPASCALSVAASVTLR